MKIFESIPLLWFVGFLFFLVLLCIECLGLAFASHDRALHDTYYVVAHGHYVLSQGLLLLIFGGWYYLYPKITGLKYSLFWARIHFWLTFVGLCLTHVSTWYLSVVGIPRRYADFQEAIALYNNISILGSYLVPIGLVFFLLSMFFGKRCLRGND